VQLHTPPSSTETVYSTPGLDWLGTLQLLKTYQDIFEASK
jgi:hypothetical protein